ncbi:hypothetical protein UFOVP1015_51, partial [uncultured Caudovirales phage]
GKPKESFDQTIVGDIKITLDLGDKHPNEN